MTTTDPRAWLAEAQERAEIALADVDAGRSDYLMGLQDAVHDLLRIPSALTAVLDLLDRAEKAANDSPARMFGGAPFPAVLDADVIRTAVTEHLTKEDHHG